DDADGHRRPDHADVRAANAAGGGGEV
ncbi:MAG: hypothetical protein AVDCRST_MAG65-2224, partial [uncultured Solirubrobacteraceae bacterium]